MHDPLILGALYQQASEVLKWAVEYRSHLMNSRQEGQEPIDVIQPLVESWKYIADNGRFQATSSEQELKSTIILWLTSFNSALRLIPCPKQQGDNIILLSLNDVDEYYQRSNNPSQILTINRASLLYTLTNLSSIDSLSDKDFGIIVENTSLTADRSPIITPETRFYSSFCNSLKKLNSEKELDSMSLDDLFWAFSKHLFHAGNRLSGRVYASLYSKTIDSINQILKDDDSLSNKQLIKIIFNQFYILKRTEFNQKLIQTTFNLPSQSSSQVPLTSSPTYNNASESPSPYRLLDKNQILEEDNSMTNNDSPEPPKENSSSKRGHGPGFVQQMQEKRLKLTRKKSDI